MRRTELLQEVRKMRFEEAYGSWQGRRLTQEEAARLLGVCTLQWVHLVHRRLFGPLGHVPPAAFEAHYDHRLRESAMASAVRSWRERAWGGGGWEE